MKVQEMLNALPVLQKVMELKLPIKKAHAIYKLAKKCGEDREFFAGEERKLIEKYAGEIMEDGNIRFKDAETQIKFSQEHFEMMQTEIEGFDVIELNFNDLGNAEITPVELMALEGVINIVE